MPFFSVITINLNNRTGLERTMKSVVSQSFNDFEYIVVDGLSTDGSIDVIKSHGKRVSKWISELDSGVYNAMNKGLRLAQGEYILFLNSGDEFKTQDALQVFKDKSSNAEFVFCDVELFGNGNDRVKKHPDTLGIRFQLTDMICHQAVLAKRELFEKTGPFAEKYKVYGDYDWMMKALRIHHASIRHIPDVLVRYHEIGISNTTHWQKQRIEKDTIHDAYFNKYVLSLYRMYRKWNDKRDGIKTAGKA